MDGVICLDRAEKFFGSRKVVGPVSLNVSANEVVSIIGPSGAGKTTLLRLIAGLESTDSGRVDIRGSVGMVFQHCFLWPHKTVLQNITEALVSVKGKNKQTAYSEALLLLQRFGLSNLAHAFPERLSGGEAQRVALARSIALEPDVLLLDEVTSALDSEKAAGVVSIIKEIAREGKRSIVLVTHDLRLAREISDKVVFLEGGVVVEQGHPRAVLLNPETQRVKNFLKMVM